jgi:hypothetical protein
MAISLEQVKEIFPEHLCLEISELDLQKAKSVAAHYVDPVVSDRVFLNSLCLDIILPTITDIFDIKPSSIDSKKINQQHEKVWQSLPGVAIDLPQVRLVLMPTEDFDTEELRLKQEWLNNPDLAGDIYLAVQVSLQESWLRVWGFTSHQELHEQGSYDVSDGSYAIDRSDLWMSLEAIPAIVSQKLLLKPSVLVAPRELAPTQSLSQKIFSKIWQPWDELVASLNMNLATVRQSRLKESWGRKIDLQLDIAHHSLAVLIGFQEEKDSKYFIQVRLHPNGQMYLPENVELFILESDGKSLTHSISREADNWIQVEFRGKLKEEFQVKIQLEEASIIEKFEI